jgi:CheY-like chemotaxis protein
VGQLAGGIAHDFNNILTAILGNVELLHLGLDSIVDPADPVLDWLNQVTDAAQRAADLTRQLLAFSRKQLLNPRVLDPVALVYGVEDMLRRVIREDIALEISCEPNILHVRADAGQIEQVLLNLVVNARDALPQGGKIKINVQNVNIGSRYAQQIAELKSGEYVAICVEDNGKGIPKDVVEQVFEPFFTTKSSGEGTGLGLAMVHGIVKQSCGHVRVESREGQGALFEVYLPAIREEIVGEQKAEILLGELRGDETVLVCEDDDAIRSLAVHALKSKGYVVLEASNANDALRIDRELDKPIDALVTDVIMPGMNGKDLADSLVNRHPQLRVLFVSGYTADVIGEHGVMQEGMEFLEKPYTSRNLVQRLRAILDKE